MRAGKPRERRHEGEAPRNRRLPEVGNLRPLPEQTERPRPVHRRPRRIDPAVERIGRPLPGPRPGHRRQRPRPGGRQRLPGDRQHEGPGPEGDLRLPRRGAAMPAQGRLLVHHARRQPPAPDLPKLPRRRRDHGQRLHRHPEQRAQLRIPRAGVQPHQRRPRRRRRVRLAPPRQPMPEPRIRRPEPEPPPPRQRRRLRHMRHDPPHLRGREIRIERQPRPRQRQRLRAFAPCSRSVTSAVRSSCQTITGDTGSPVSASQARQLSP